MQVSGLFECDRYQQNYRSGSGVVSAAQAISAEGRNRRPQPLSLNEFHAFQKLRHFAPTLR